MSHGANRHLYAQNVVYTVALIIALCLLSKYSSGKPQGVVRLIRALTPDFSKPISGSAFCDRQGEKKIALESST
jgi:hypothetical protein